MNSSIIEDSNGVWASETELSKTIKFWFLLVGVCSSLPCYLLVIYQFLIDRKLRETPHNHVVIANLFINFSLVLISLNSHLIYLRLGYIFPSTSAICLVWQFLDYGFWFGDLFLKLWASIERHILIFHSSKMSTTRGRWIVHYIPLGVFFVYCPSFYIYFIFFYPIPYEYHFSVLLCGGPVFYNDIPAWLLWYESLFHYVIPIFLTIIFTTILPIRFLIHKNRLRVNRRWNQYRKMVIQLISMTVVYVFDLPYIVVTIVRWSGYPDFGTTVQGPYFYYINFIPNLLLPFTLLGTISNSLKRRMGLYCQRKRRSVAVAPLRTKIS